MIVRRTVLRSMGFTVSTETDLGCWFFFLLLSTSSLPWCYLKTTINSAKFENFKPFFLLQWHVKGFSSKRIVESRCATGPERKKNCLKARPCIFQSGNFTGCGSEGVNGWLRYTMVPVKAYYHTLITFGQTACGFVFCYTYQFFFCCLWGYFVTECIVCLTCFPGPWPSNLSFLFFFLFFPIALI